MNYEHKSPCRTKRGAFSSVQPCVLALGFLGLFSSVATVAFARTTPINSADRFGDYYSNNAPVRGTAPSGLMPGSLWRVVAQNLNCRSRPAPSSRIIKVFTQGDVIQAEVGRGGSGRVFINSGDSSGKPWMWVRGGQVFKNSSSLKCYVRANSRYINPYRPKR